MNLFQIEINFSDKDVFLAFNLAKKVETDEIDGMQMQQLSQKEFIEVLARIAEVLALPMLGDEDA